MPTVYSACGDTPWRGVLHAVIESFVLREGTDYGEKEFSLADKVARVHSQLRSGEAKIVFDPESESVTIVA